MAPRIAFLWSSAALALLACTARPAAVEAPAASSAATTDSDSVPAPAQPKGYWVGSIALPNNQSLDWAIAIEPGAEQGAEPTAHLWIPKQLVTKLPVGAPIIADDGSWTVSLAQVGATWTVRPGESPTCEFRQAGMTFDCDLEALSEDEFLELLTPARPQTPAPPFPYAIEEVEIPNPAAPGVTLAGTLTIPTGAGPHPAIVMITGSGPQDRDETIEGHKFFWVIADHLSRQGIAVLRYDDRGVGSSTGQFKTATSVDFASDAYAAAHWLASHSAIDPERIGLIGHSEGGVIAPMVGAEHPDEIDFLVLLAGTGVRGDALIVHQLGLILAAEGTDAETIAKAQADTRAQHQAVLERGANSPEAVLRQVMTDRYAQLPADERPSPEQITAAIAAAVGQFTPWFEYFLTYDPIPALKKIKVPVLILAGDKDLQVDPDQNIAPMKAALKRNRKVEVVRFPGLNHLFQPATTGSPSEYGIIEQTIAPEVLERITTWLQATTGVTKP